ncbi:ATP-dependent zinc protease family protein [Aquimarina mytili]|uniref:ATP-dependent zinc protease n=1 Tax=Aquimarina mytili TaxID=874423 RepID=A0A937D786_9FLAO|nr:RimK/LysX family protein [Aquimarina mytili]MBL0685254.1 ATP-dependent zinc protease [Aquimarina mytili]
MQYILFFLTLVVLFINNFLEKEKKIIGRTDKADFPLLELKDIDAKMDTGAYTSSIHCVDIREMDQTLQCSFLDATHPEYNGKRFTFKNYDISAVKSNTGKVEVRYAIRTQITLFGQTFPITLTLSPREDMRFPVLIGRKFLSGKFLVDPQLENQSYNQKLE